MISLPPSLSLTLSLSPYVFPRLSCRFLQLQSINITNLRHSCCEAADYAATQISRRLLVFSLQKKCTLVLVSVLTLLDLCLLFHPAHRLTTSFKSSTFSHFLLSFSKSGPLNFVKHWKKHTETNSQGQTQGGYVHTHMHTHTSLPTFTLPFCHSHPFHCKASKTLSKRCCWSANRTHSTVLNMVRAIQSFLLHRQTLTPFSKVGHPWSAVPGVYELQDLHLSSWSGTEKLSNDNKYHLTALCWSQFQNLLKVSFSLWCQKLHLLLLLHSDMKCEEGSVSTIYHKTVCVSIAR